MRNRNSYLDEPTASLAERQRVLMFAYFFPPLGGGGVQRTLKHVKYLPSQGFESIVIAGRPRWFVLRDDTLEREVPPGTLVVRARTLPVHQVQWKLDGLLRRAGLSTRLIRQALLPDGQVGWLPGAVWHGLRVVRSRRPNVIYSTSQPATAHLVALIVHRLTGLPWVADFRDSWTLSTGPASSSYAPPVHVSAALERRVIAEASYVTVACPSIELVDRPPGDQRFVLIRNGVDPDDLGLESAAEAGPDPDRFRLSHVGSLYGSRDAAPVFAAIGQLIGHGTLDTSRFDLRIVGPPSSNGAELDAVPTTFTGYVDHRQAVAEMASASALLFHQPPEQLGSSGKIYEYLASGRPILCVAHPDNAAYRLVQELGAGECADARDAGAAVGALGRLLAQWKQGTLAVDPGVRDEALRRFSRRKLAGDLARVLRAAIAEYLSADERR